MTRLFILFIFLFSQFIFNISSLSANEYIKKDTYFDPIKINFPDCSSSNPEVSFIRTANDWQNINSPDHRIFCVEPGDYTSLGEITLTADGIHGKERFIRYYNPKISGETNPINMNENDRVIINSLAFNNANYWIVDKITLTRPDIYISHIYNDSDNNILNNILAYNFLRGIYIKSDSDNTIIQGSVIHTQKEGDYVAIALDARTGSRQILNTKILSNEIFDINDGVMLLGDNTDVENFEGTIIYDNDIYLTSAHYSDCSGNRLPTGSCACAENAIDIKSGSNSPNNPVGILYNRIWGYRHSDKNCGPSSSEGTELVFSRSADNVDIEGNIFFDGKEGLRITFDGTNINISGNLIHGMKPYNDQGGTAILNIDSVTINFINNVISENNSVGILSSPGINWIANTLINNTKGPTGTPINPYFSDNRYYATLKPKWDTNPSIDEVTATNSNYMDFCFSIKKITKNETTCLNHASPLNTSLYPPSPPRNLY